MADEGTGSPSPILTGPIARNLLRIALPAIGSSLVMTLNSFVDRAFLGRLPDVSATLAAQTGANEVLVALMAALTGIAVGNGAIVGRAIGAGKIDEARDGARQSVTLALVASVALAVPLALLRVPLLGALGLKGTGLELGQGYFLWLMVGLPSLFSLVLFNGLFNLMGETRRAFYVVTCAVATHIVFDWLLIFGNFGLPALGLKGGAISMGLSQVVATALFVHFLGRTPLKGMLRGSWRPSWTWARRLLDVSLPAVGRQLLNSAGLLLIQAMLFRSAVSAVAGAAYGNGVLAESLSALPGQAFAGAAAAFVGQNLGAGQPGRARAAAWTATLFAVGLMSGVGILFALFAPTLVGAMVRAGDPDADQVIALTVQYLRTTVFAQPFLALTLVLQQALNGAGETRTPRTITAVVVVLRVALVYTLMDVVGWGPRGAWWAIAILPTLSAALTYAAFVRGKWLRTKV